MDITPKEESKPIAIVEKNTKENSCAFMLTYFPTWENVDLDLVIPSSELIFVVDRYFLLSFSHTPETHYSLILRNAYL